MSYYIDAASPAKSNWLRYVNCARNVHEENLKPIICDGLVFYMTSKDVEPDTELLVWYGTEYGKHLGITRMHPSKYGRLFSNISLFYKDFKVDYATLTTIFSYDLMVIIHVRIFITALYTKEKKKLRSWLYFVEGF